MKFKLFLVIVLLLSSLCMWADNEIIDYVNKNDNSYTYKFEKLQLSADMSTSVSTISMTSQKYRSKELNQIIEFYFPNNAYVTDTSLMIILDGKSNSNISQCISYLSVLLSAPITVLYPNPTENTDNVSNASLYAESFKDAIKSNNFSDIPLTNADVKSVIKAMDTIEKVTFEKFDYPIGSFVLCGSKFYAHSIWLAASLGDDRIKGIIPLNYDFINIEKQIEKQKSYLSGLSLKITENGFDFLSKQDDVTKKLISVFDPYTYKDKIKCPKLIVTNYNNEIYTIDALNQYAKDFGDECFVYSAVLQNKNEWMTNSSMNYSSISGNAELVNNIIAFFYHIVKNFSYEKLNYSFTTQDKEVLFKFETTSSNKIQKINYYDVNNEGMDYNSRSWNTTNLSLGKDTVLNKTAFDEKFNYSCVAEVVFVNEAGITYSEWTLPYTVVNKK